MTHGSSVEFLLLHLTDNTMAIQLARNLNRFWEKGNFSHLARNRKQVWIFFMFCLSL